MSSETPPSLKKKAQNQNKIQNDLKKTFFNLIFFFFKTKKKKTQSQKIIIKKPKNR